MLNILKRMISSPKPVSKRKRGKKAETYLKTPNTRILTKAENLFYRKNLCPSCKGSSDKFHYGPTLGLSVNICCKNCNATFNSIPILRKLTPIKNTEVMS